MKTLAYIPLHYGASYLEAVLTSINPFVDKTLILYSSKPTYGHGGNIPNPDSKNTLFAICEKFENVVWWDVTRFNISRENSHRQMVFDYVRQEKRAGNKFDLVLPVDADEVHDQANIEELLHTGYKSNYHYHNVRGSQWFHFWKGHKEVNRDGFAPMRLINLNNNNNATDHIEVGRIYHMGYAITQAEMEYKLSCHGHKSEIASSWFTNKWANYQKGKTTHLHPASRDVWIETEEFDGVLPDYMPNPYH